MYSTLLDFMKREGEVTLEVLVLNIFQQNAISLDFVCAVRQWRLCSLGSQQQVCV